MENAAVSLETAPTVLTSISANDHEARAELLARAHRKTGRLPVPLLVDHILAVTRGASWAVRREALDAVLRRLASMQSDALRVAVRPAAAGVFGTYAVRKPRMKGPAYEQILRSAVPLEASCGCPDFLRNSLGLCKHVLAILDDLARVPRKFRAAVTARKSDPAGAIPRLAWNPVRPLSGPGSWWERLSIIPAARGGSRVPRKGFTRGVDGAATADPAAWAEPADRRKLVGELLAALDRQALAADPAPAALLQEERQILDRRGILPEDDVRRHLRTMKRKLYPYQVEGVARMMAAGRLLLADDMGLGKTAQAIATAHALFTSGRVQRGLVVAPASLKPQWEREWNLFTEVPVAIVEGGPEGRAECYRRRSEGFLIANYEQVIRDADLICAWDPDFVILDEAQRIKNWETKTAGSVKRLNPRWRLVLTGTPMENRLGELASIMDWVDNHALEPKWRLAPLHAVTAGDSHEIVGAAGLDTLRSRLAPAMLRRLRTEVLSQLPSRTDTVVPVTLTPAQAEEHDALSPSIASLIQRAKKRPLTQAEFLKLMQLLTVQRMIADGLALRDFDEVWPGIRGRHPFPAVLDSLGAPKLGEFREILTQVAVNQGRRMVVFSQWRRMLELAHWAVSDILSGSRLRAAFFTGQESLRQRTRNIVDFHDDPSTRILFATDAGGVGLNLQRAATCCVNLDLPWNPAVLEQRIGRIYRLGQTKPIDVYNLVTQASIEERILTLVADKQALFRGLFDGTSDEVTFERSGSFLDTVARLVQAPGSPDSRAAPSPEEPPSEDLDRRDDDAVNAVVEVPEAAIPDRVSDRVSGSEDVAGSHDSFEYQRSTEAPAPMDQAPTPLASSSEATPASGGAPDRSLALLFTRLAVRRTENGGLSLEAHPEDAATLASVFEGLAGLLRQASLAP